MDRARVTRRSPQPTQRQLRLHSATIHLSGGSLRRERETARTCRRCGAVTCEECSAQASNEASYVEESTVSGGRSGGSGRVACRSSIPASPLLPAPLLQLLFHKPVRLSRVQLLLSSVQLSGL